MKIIGIETSCDETAISILENNKIKSNIIYSQIKEHTEYGGVVPEIASRKHVEKIIDVLEISLKEAKTNISEIDYIAVTSNPGLVGSLVVGKTMAKAISLVIDKPIIYLDHVIAHAFSIDQEIKFPYLSFVISGGHTHLLLFNNYHDYKVIGKTLDDSIGESYDKVAKMMDLEYPGGPIIEKLSQESQCNNLPSMPEIKTKDLNMSFSGLKSHVKRLINEKKYSKEDIARSFQNKIIEEISKKINKAINKYSPKTISITGGVSNNKSIREYFKNIYFPNKDLSSDNGAMIARYAYFYLKEKEKKNG